MAKYLPSNMRNTAPPCCLHSAATFFLLVLAFNMLFSAAGVAQPPGGTITDRAGTPLPFATIVACQNGIVKGGANAGESGSFSLAGLPAGKYDLRINFEGHSYELKNQDLGGAQLLHLSIDLRREVELNTIEVRETVPVEVSEEEVPKRRKRNRR